MATDRNKLFEGIKNGAAWDAGVVFNRTNGIPLDKWSIFETEEAAAQYAASNPVAYPGQLIAVVPDSGDPVGYIITKDGKLKEIGTGSTEGFATEDYVDLQTKDTLKYTEQTLTEAQKTQAKLNIGISDSVILTQEEYEELQANGKIVATTYYYIYEEV